MLRAQKFLLSAVILIISIIPVTVFASPSNNDALFNGVCGQGGTSANSVVCQDRGVPGNNANNNPLLGSDGLLLKISGILALIAGVSAIIVIIISGLSFITSGGDPAKAQKARGTLTGALIGLVVIVLAESIIGFILSKV